MVTAIEAVRTDLNQPLSKMAMELWRLPAIAEMIWPVRATMRIRRCLQFSLRSWMLLLTTICVFLAWHARTERRRREAIEAIETMGGEVVAYDPTGADTVYIMFVQGAIRNADGTVTDPPGFQGGLIHYGPKITLTDEGLEYVRRVGNVHFLRIDGVPITDAGLPRLYSLKSLRDIHLRHTRVSAAGRAALCRAMPNCQIDVSP